MWGIKGSKSSQESDASGWKKNSKRNKGSRKIILVEHNMHSYMRSLEAGFWLEAYCRLAWGKMSQGLPKLRQTE